MCSLALRISLAPLYRSVIYWSNICLESRELTLSMHEEEGGGGGGVGGWRFLQFCQIKFCSSGDHRAENFMVQ